MYYVLVNKVQSLHRIFYLTDIEGYVIIVSQGHRSSGLRDGSMTPDATVTGIVILYYGFSSGRLGEPLSRRKGTGLAKTY